MNTVIFIVTGHEVYIGDYYKDKFKAITFKDKDCWEVYDAYDFKDLIEYMNYPLHFNRFKDSMIKIVYTDSKFYTIITETAELFENAQGVHIGYLPNVLLGLGETLVWEPEQKSKVIAYAHYNYKLIKDLQGRLKVELCTDEEEDIVEMDTKMLCEWVLKEELVKFDKSEVVLSPITLKKSRSQERLRYLEVENIIEEVCFEEEKEVAKDEMLLVYTRYMKKLFNREDKKQHYIKAKQEGIFYSIKQQDNQQIWANKDEIIGVIVKKEQSRESLKSWLQNIGFFACNSK